MDWKLSAELVGVWVMFISMASLVEPSAGAKVPVISRISPMVKAVPVIVQNVCVVAALVIVVVYVLWLRDKLPTGSVKEDQAEPLVAHEPQLGAVPPSRH